jgi:hypothetical protein
MRRVLAKTVTGSKRRFDAVVSCEPVDGHARGEDGGLGVLGEQQPFFWSLETQRAQRLAERIVRLRERVATDRIRRGEILPHADFLGSLTWKDRGNHRIGSFMTSCVGLGRHFPGEMFEEPVGHGASGHSDGIADRLGRRSSMPHDTQSVDAHERRAAVLGIVETLAKPPIRLPREQITDARPERGGKLVVEE